ncbi:LysR substrate-binding domain-containing protein [Nitrospirillum viridazoti]|uniref:LysR family transcriptional regulator n=1 Tax=Nitrospirillum viridazoti CBAmc TaxID=1441467 RepID=A0A248JWA5_9PROT|nr:LysR substrate-binding domain-containing protein [Nitrospirillum amazonense]ASG22771.1 LysR family transcriptional regulator [Nitrospirillum amazonense CBAmc]
MRAPEHLNALRAFEAAARHLSFAMAADELNVTPAAVGQLVRRLEQVIGFELFHRSQSGAARLVLTEAAQAALPELRAGFEHLAGGMARLRAAGGRRRKGLTVTVSFAFGDRWLMPRLDGFRRRYPACELLIDMNTNLSDFSKGDIDVGLRYGAGNWQGLSATYITRDSFFPVCSPALMDGAHPLRSPEDLAHFRLIHDVSLALLPDFRTWRDWFENIGREAPDTSRGLRVNDSTAAYRLAVDGGGVALGRTTLVTQDLVEGRLVRPFGPTLESPLAYYAVCRPQDFDDPMIAAFRDWLVEEGARSETDGRPPGPR